MALKINIKPGERFVINGAVMSVEDRGTSLILQNHAAFLREKDIMQEDDANTPAKRIYFYVMLMYVDPENQESYRDDFMRYLGDFMSGCRIKDVRESLAHIYAMVSAGKFYQALKVCKTLMDFEREVLKIVQEPPPKELAAKRTAGQSGADPS